MSARIQLVRALAGVAIAGSIALSGTALAQETINMSYNGPPEVDQNAVHRFASNFKQFVELRTGGEIQIRLYPNSQLGEEADRMEQVMTGPMFNVASLAGMQTVFPEIFAGNAPFMFDTYEAAHWFYEQSEYWQEATQAFRERTGAVLLEAVEEGGFMAFTNSERPIHSPDDFSGLQFRAMDESQVALYEAFGASGTPVPWTEVYTALRTGVADGQMNPPMYILIGSLQEVQDHMTMANIQYSMQFLVANGDWMDGLPEAHQQAIRRAAHDANVINRIWVETKVEDRVATIAEAGVEVYRPSEAEMTAFREQGQPAYMDWLRQEIDERWIELAISSAEEASERVAADS